MKKIVLCALVLVGSSAISAVAADAPAGPAPKGTVCFSNALRNTEAVPISCKGLGKFASVAEIYDRGYRVVSTGVITEAGTGTVYLIIEERK
jgi:hypothetical protein